MLQFLKKSFHFRTSSRQIEYMISKKSLYPNCEIDLTLVKGFCLILIIYWKWIISLKKKPFDSIDPYSIHIWTLDCIVTIEMHFYGSFTVLYPFSFCFHLLQNMDKVHWTVSCWIDSKGCDGHTWHVAVFSSRWSNLDKLLSTALLSISVRFIFYALIFQISN